MEAPRVDDATDSKYPNACEVASSNASNTSPAGVVVAEGPQQGHRLVRREGHIPRRHPIPTQTPTQLFAGGGVLTVEQAHQTLSRHRAFQAQLGGAVAAPLPGGGTTPQVVVLPG